MSTNKLPIVAIVGRANVGKSSLFNRFINEPRAVVAREAGTTRDSISEIVQLEEKAFWLVDTAGLKTPEDDFEATIQEQIGEAIELADIIVVVVDGGVMPTEEDRKVAKQALRSKKEVILVINKIDTAKKNDLSLFDRLGIKLKFWTAATHNRGIDQALEGIASSLPHRTKVPETEEITVALVGRPNVGKSYLFNRLVKKQQAIVADVAGTTRDVNARVITYHGTPIKVLDTAGIRRNGKIEQGIEKFSVLRSVWAIEQSDICLLVMDANEPNTKLDQKIAGMIKDAGKGLIVTMSKWDSIEKDPFTHDQMAKDIGRSLKFIPWAPLIFTSAVSGQNVSRLYELITEVNTARKQKIPTSKLNDWLHDTIERHPPAGLKKYQPKLNYVTQTDFSPPSFTIFGRHANQVHWSYKRHLDRTIREQFGYEGTPVQFYFKEKS